MLETLLRQSLFFSIVTLAALSKFLHVELHLFVELLIRYAYLFGSLQIFGSEVVEPLRGETKTFFAVLGIRLQTLTSGF